MGAVLNHKSFEGSAVEKPTEDRIRQRAHDLWEQNHRPDGKEKEFWHQAERELEGAEQGAEPAKEAHGPI
jgi:hypothetical protein